MSCLELLESSLALIVAVSGRWSVSHILGRLIGAISIRETVLADGSNWLSVVLNILLVEFLADFVLLESLLLSGQLLTEQLNWLMVAKTIMLRLALASLFNNLLFNDFLNWLGSLLALLRRSLLLWGLFDLLIILRVVALNDFRLIVLPLAALGHIFVGINLVIVRSL